MKRIATFAILGFVLLIGVLALFTPEAAAIGGISTAAIAVFARTCGKNVSGNAAVYFTEKANMTAFTVTAGEVSAVTVAVGETFHQADVDIDTLIRTQTGEGAGNNLKYTHRIEMSFSRLDAALSAFADELVAASACGILAIVQDGNGECWLVGFNETDQFNRPLRVVSDTDNSGAEPGAEDGGLNILALECSSGYRDLSFDATNAAAIVAGSAAFITYN